MNRREIRELKTDLVAEAKTYISRLNPIKSEQDNEAALEILSHINNAIGLATDPVSMIKRITITETIPNCIFNTCFHNPLKHLRTVKYSAVKCRRRLRTSDYHILTNIN
jgi:hypothetical protein